MSSIPISPQHGLNPSVLICPCCGKSETIALLGRLKDDAQAPREMLDTGPCGKCRIEFDALKDKGFVLFIIGPGDRGSTWQRYLGLHVITRAAVEKVFTGVDLSAGCAFITVELAESIGLKLHK